MIQTATRPRPRQADEHSANLPRYELRLRVVKGNDFELEVWQLPSSATPRLTAPEYVAGLKGSALRLIEPRLLKRLSRVKINLNQPARYREGVPPGEPGPAGFREGEPPGEPSNPARTEPRPPRITKGHSGTMNAEQTRAWPIDEDLALNLGLLFRVLAPMRNLDRIRQISDGVDEMSREEAGYWLGMAMHRKNPRRVLAALRLLLTTH